MASCPHPPAASYWPAISHHNTTITTTITPEFQEELVWSSASSSLNRNTTCLPVLSKPLPRVINKRQTNKQTTNKLRRQIQPVHRWADVLTDWSTSNQHKVNWYRTICELWVILSSPLPPLCWEQNDGYLFLINDVVDNSRERISAGYKTTRSFGPKATTMDEQHGQHSNESSTTAILRTTVYSIWWCREWKPAAPTNDNIRF